MIVPVFNYHSSIITIIVKNNKALICQSSIKFQISSEADTK